VIVVPLGLSVTGSVSYFTASPSFIYDCHPVAWFLLTSMRLVQFCTLQLFVYYKPKKFGFLVEPQKAQTRKKS
jgi:hypothetical protein